MVLLHAGCSNWQNLFHEVPASGGIFYGVEGQPLILKYFFKLGRSPKIQKILSFRQLLTRSMAYNQVYFVLQNTQGAQINKSFFSEVPARGGILLGPTPN
jgi:hypothetical protein